MELITALWAVYGHFWCMKTTKLIWKDNEIYHVGLLCWFDVKQDHLKMNVAPDQTIIVGLQIFLDHRLLSSIGQKIMMIVPPPSPFPPFLPLFPMVFFTDDWWKDGWMDHAPYIVTISRAPTAMDPCWLLGMGTFSVEPPYTKTYVCHAFANFWAIS